MSNPKIVVVGGGSAGITTAAHLLNTRPDLDVTIIEPSDKHYYQPLWTLIGGGVFPKEESEREQADFIPQGATWMKDAVESFDPQNNTVKTVGGESVAYDYLVVCPGLQLNWTGIKGLSKGIVGKHGICSNYSFDTVDSTWEAIRNFQGGTALFTHPNTPVKCGGAPQKICYLAEDHFRKQGIRDKCNVVFALAKPRIFAVDPYATTLEKMVERKNIDVKLQHNLKEIRPEAKEAVFEIARHRRRGHYQIRHDSCHSNDGTKRLHQKQPARRRVWLGRCGQALDATRAVCKRIFSWRHVERANFKNGSCDSQAGTDCGTERSLPD